MNLTAYFDRIGFSGPTDATLETLRGIVFAQACSIPFENLDIPLRRGVSLADEAIEQKLVHDRRGGYCFEQNSLLMRVLGELGFEVTPLSARVRQKAPRDFIPARTHMFLRVTINEIPWMADIGIGGLTPTGPIRLDTLDAAQETPHDVRRIIREDRVPFPRYFHQALLGEEWADVTEFTLEEMPVIDRELGNWWTSTSPVSKFHQNHFAALARPDGTRISVNNREFTHRRGSTILEQFQMANGDELLRVLDERFGLRFSAGTRFEFKDP